MKPKKPVRGSRTSGRAKASKTPRRKPARRKAKSRPRRKGGGAAWKWLAVGVAGLASLALAAAATVVTITEMSLPAVPSFAEYAVSVPKVSRILDRDGSVVAEFFTERRTLTMPDSIPPLVEKAVLAAEDAGFRGHEGISYWSIFRAMASNVWRGRISQGGSTITQQAVKQVLLSPERTYTRKFREMLLARLFEKKLTKDEILAMYVSEVYLGRGRYGFEEAARFYFARPASRLSLAQAAMLAGMMSAPEGNNPVTNPEGAVMRQRYVLERMAKEGFVTEEEARDAADTRLRVWARGEPGLGTAPYFVDAVRREALKLFGKGRLLHDGLTVETTLDPRVSSAAEAAVADGVRELRRKGRSRKADERSAAGAGALLDGTDELLDELPPPPKAVRARVLACDPTREALFVEVGGMKAVLDPRSLARLGPHDWKWRRICNRTESLAVSAAGRKMDIDGHTMDVVNAEIGPQAAIAVLDPKDRGVLALVGGDDFGTRPFNRAVQSRRPIGSTVKPFLYAAALAGHMDPSTVFTNSRIRLRGARGRSWSPRNFGGGWDGREYGLAGALIRSINVIAVKVMRRIGPGPVADLLESLGIRGHVPRDLSLALGSAEASPLDLANAFCIFGTGGMHDTPYMIARVRDHDGRTLMEHERRPKRVLSRKLAGRMRHMLRRVVTEGTARGASRLPVPAWGKTGTTNRSREAWFVGSDGEVVASVLVGYDDRLPMRGATGGNTAVPFFVSFVENLHGISGGSGSGPVKTAN